MSIRRYRLPDLFPIDIPQFVLEALQGDEREPDGLLHSSSHLTAPLRHVQLDLSGAERRPQDINSLITLMTGTTWHSYLEKKLRKSGLPIMTEVNLTPWMPTGWGGKCDWVLWSNERKAFVLGDLKTTKGAALPWILKDGAKLEHIWQLSSYWYALEEMGLPLVEGFAIAYLPKDGTLGIEVVECSMIDKGTITALMTHRKNEVDLYLAGMSELAPIPEREMKHVWNVKAKTVDVVLKPHYSSAYCRFVDCGCGDEGQTKIGSWSMDDAGNRQYIPRAGYDRPENQTVPHEREFKK